jgi:hypothetical protein
MLRDVGVAVAVAFDVETRARFARAGLELCWGCSCADALTRGRFGPGSWSYELAQRTAGASVEGDQPGERLHSRRIGRRS